MRGAYFRTVEGTPGREEPKKKNGDVPKALALLQADEVLNNDGIFNRLAAATLSSWYKAAQPGLLPGPPGQGSRPQSVSPIADITKKALCKDLIELGEAGATLNSSSLYGPFYYVIEKHQPEIYIEA